MSLKTYINICNQVNKESEVPFFVVEYGRNDYEILPIGSVLDKIQDIQIVHPPLSEHAKTFKPGNSVSKMFSTIQEACANCNICLEQEQCILLGTALINKHI